MLHPHLAPSSVCNRLSSKSQALSIPVDELAGVQTLCILSPIFNCPPINICASIYVVVCPPLRGCVARCLYQRRDRVIVNNKPHVSSLSRLAGACLSIILAMCWQWRPGLWRGWSLVTGRGTTLTPGGQSGQTTGTGTRYQDRFCCCWEFLWVWCLRFCFWLRQELKE